MEDRTEWEQATRQQRHLAMAADAELRRRHPDQRFHAAALSRTSAHHGSPARRAHPDGGGGEPGDEPVDHGPSGGAPLVRRQAGRTAKPGDPAEDPDYEDLGPAFPPGQALIGTRSCNRLGPRPRRPRGYWNVPWIKTWTWRLQIDSGPVRAGSRRGESDGRHRHRRRGTRRRHADDLDAGSPGARTGTLRDR
jgi:hypothetical protein